MKRMLLGLMVLLALSMLAPLASADIATEWDAAFGGPEADMAFDVQPTRDVYKRQASSLSTTTILTSWMSWRSPCAAICCGGRWGWA